jgi:hypothetical protein
MNIIANTNTTSYTLSHFNPNESQKKMSEKSIPGISYHLIFCFLTLKELTLISQCSNEFRQLVTNKQFLNMYSWKKMITFSDRGATYLISSSPFKCVVEHIEFSKPHRSSDDFDSPKYSIFLLHFFKVLPLFLNLTTLEIEFLYSINMNNINISSICQLTKLESLFIHFGMNLIHLVSTQIIDTVRLLPRLEILDVFNLFNFDEDPDALSKLQHLCEQPGAPQELKTIRSISGGIYQIQHLECYRLLQQIPKLDTVEFLSWNGVSSFPVSLARWVQKIDIYHRYIVDDDIMALSKLNRLDSIGLMGCEISSASLAQLIAVHSKRLKELKINDLFSTADLISFATISQCTELTQLLLSKCLGLVADEFHLLNNCKKLQEIQLSYCGFNMNDLSIDQQNALKIPSRIFPLLEHCKIDI